MGVLNPLYWHLSVDEQNELSRIEWEKTLSESEKKAESKMRVIVNAVIDTILNNKARNRLKTKQT